MLKKLLIKNYALIDSLSVDFSAGLNIITGETGAGKSIIIGALGLLLGERAKTDVIRHNQKTAFVEGVFQVHAENLHPKFPDEFPIFKNELIIRREVHQNGRSRAFINDSPVSLQILVGVGNLLIDLHGQHAHQSLLRTDQHIDFLDAYHHNADLLESVKTNFSTLNQLHETLKNIENKEQHLKEKQELHEFQLSEIQSINPLAGEDETLIQQEKILRNSERILETVQQLKLAFQEGDRPVFDSLASIENTLSAFEDIDSDFTRWRAETESARLILEEVLSQLESFSGKLDYDPEKIESLRERIAAIQRLKKKFGGTIQSVLEYKTRIHNELQESVAFDEKRNEIRQRILKTEEQLLSACQRLSQHRRHSADELRPLVEEMLRRLGMPYSAFDIQIEIKASPSGLLSLNNQPILVTEKGMDDIAFFISTNTGEPLKPLASTASGGEISRIMLALKSVLADSVPILVFDEIDTGISGRIADVVGNSLLDIAKSHQIICITHLPQIAAKAQTHYVVEKTIKNETTRTRIRQLNEHERVEQIAGLLGGSIISEKTMATARELINQDVENG